MIEFLNNITINNKKYTFEKIKKNKQIYKYENNETEEISILELEMYSDTKQVKKIDIFNYFESKPLESYHIARGIDNMVEINYYSSANNVIKVNDNYECSNISIYKLYSEIETNPILEDYQIELVKKGHRKHRVLTKLPLTENSYVTKDNFLHSITGDKINEIDITTDTMIKDVITIENHFKTEKTNIYHQIDTVSDTIVKKVITKKKSSKKEKDEHDDEIVELDLEKMAEYPEKIFVYDREYTIFGISKKQNKIIYNNQSEDDRYLEIYFSKDNKSILEIRIIIHKETIIDGVKINPKLRIIRVVKTEDDNFKASLCNRKKEPISMSVYSIEKGLLKSNAILDKRGNIISNEVSIEAADMGRFVLTQTKDIFSFIDKEETEYRINSSSYMNFIVFTSYMPGIMNYLKETFIPEEINKVKEI